jgi:hypothetical protein
VAEGEVEMKGLSLSLWFLAAFGLQICVFQPTIANGSLTIEQINFIGST